MSLLKFQFTRAGERATRAEGEEMKKELFQFTRAGERATLPSVFDDIHDLFQFTRAGERATKSSYRMPGLCRVSIHARWGARDWPPGRSRWIRGRFNSRALGSARLDVEGVHSQEHVSIHARWGARDCWQT